MAKNFRTSCFRITAPCGWLIHTGKKRRHIHISQSTARNEMIRDSRLCEAAHHHLGTDLRQKHQFGVWIKFFLTFNKIKVIKNIFFFPLYTISTASPFNITLPGTPQHLPARTAEGWKERTKVQICIVKCNFISLSIMLFLGRIKNKTMGKNKLNADVGPDLFLIDQNIENS